MEVQDSQRRVAISRYMNILLTHSAELPEQFYINIEIDGMYLGEGGFAVAVLELQGVDRADQYESLMARLEQQLLDCLHQFAIHYVNDREDRLVCLLAFPRLRPGTSAVAESMGRLKALLETVYADFTQETGSGFRCAISNMEFGTAGIQMAYSEAVDSLQYVRFVLREPGVTSLADTEGSTQSQLDETLFLNDCADQISRMLQGRKHEEARQRLDLAMDYCVTAVPWFFPNMRLRLMNFWGHLVLALIRQNQVARAFFTEHDIMTELLMAENYSALSKVVDSFWQALIRQLVEMETQPDLLWVASVNEYIAKMSTDPNLSVLQIAEYFGMAQPAASSRYKKYTGYAISDEIQKTRIRHARQLLQSSSMPLNKVAETVGYGSLATMNRAFQKYEGVVPRLLRSR